MVPRNTIDSAPYLNPIKIPSGLPPQRKWCLYVVSPVKTADPFWGQTTWNLSGLSPKRRGGPKRGLDPKPKKPRPPGKKSSE